MNIVLNIETHAYAEDQLFDKILDTSLGGDIESCGIVCPDIILPLRRNRSKSIIVDYTEDTTLGDIANLIYNEYDLSDFSDGWGVEIAFLFEGLRYWIDNPSSNFMTIVNKYLDPKNSGRICAAIYVSSDAGTIDELDGIRYYMNSRERGPHHEAHVHVCSTSGEYEASIIIKTGELIGTFPKKLAKKAIERVLKNQKFFFEKWNALTDGLEVDINKYFGLINY